MSDAEDAQSPPGEFQATDGLAETPPAAGDASLERCPMCLRRSRRFLCCSCINDSFGFRSKKARRASLLALRDALAEKCEQQLRQRECAWKDTIVQIENLQPRLALYRRARATMLKVVEGKRKRLSDLLGEITYHSEVVATLENVCQKFARQSKEKEAQAKAQWLEVSRQRCDLTNCRCCLVDRIFEDVFPIEMVSSEGGDEERTEVFAEDDGDSTSLSEALSEAAGVHYCFDRWILMDEVSKVQFRLVNYCMAPDNSDYSSLKQFLFGLKTNVSSVSSTLFAISKCAFGSCPSLAYGSQLCTLLSRVLDINLPFAVKPTDFCMENICKEEFETAVLKFNANVAILCSSQGIDHAGLALNRPFWALVCLRNGAQRLTYVTSYRVSAECVADFEKELSQINWCESQTPQETSNTDIEDWESVSEALPEWTDTSPGSALAQIINSATSSVTSFFKAMQL